MYAVSQWSPKEKSIGNASEFSEGREKKERVQRLLFVCGAEVKEFKKEHGRSRPG
jgi:hypothetical protein